MESEFEGKTIAITGAAGGVGQLLCRYFGSRGATIAALDISDAIMGVAEQLKSEGINVKAVRVDLTKAKEVVDAFASFGDVHVLVNNAAVSFRPTLAKTDPDSWRADMEANLGAAYHCAYAVLPQMIERKGGAIVNIGSANAIIALGEPAYSAAKAGMISLTKTIALECGKKGIRCNIILPGTIRTPFWQKRQAEDPHVLEKLEKWYPLGRIVEPIEIVNTVAFLASDKAAAITGAVLPVDCGLSAGNIVMARELLVQDL